jgi:dihydrofolate reductase
MITLISAMGINNEIGANNKLLWNLPADMQYFRERTRNKIVIMGRNTFESIGKALPNRKNIILTRDKNYNIAIYQKNITKNTTIILMHSIEEVLNLEKSENINNNNSEIMVIGGSDIYKKFLPHSTHLSISFINKEFSNADSFFPEFNISEFKKISSRTIIPDINNKFEINICEFKKIIN